MPILHEESNEWIYDSICDNKFNYDPVEQIYKYSNSKYPEKKYNKTYDPKSFMSRGDVIHFGNDDYRNNNKLIFDGEKLGYLWTDVDDYGSVPPNFECGDNPNEFNIGDFEDIIDHNSINWLSKEKIKDIYIFEKNDKIWGEVMIKGKLWHIRIDICEDNTFDTRYSYNSRKFKCSIENDSIKIHKRDSYLIEAADEENINKLKSMITENNNVNISILHYNFEPNIRWFLFYIKNETKFSDMVNTPNFPILIKNGDTYIYERFIFNKEEYDTYMKANTKVDNIYINERKGESRITLANNKKAKRLLNWEPKVDIKDYLLTKLGMFRNIKEEALHN
jgi:hypothetical protein